MPQPLTITFNGMHLEVPAHSTVQRLLELQGISGRIAVEINGDIVPRSEYLTRELHGGDRVEVVHAIGGGRGAAHVV